MTAHASRALASATMFGRLRGYIWREWYQRLAKSYHLKEWKFMNYGYAPLEDPPETTPLEKEDAENRYNIQLYHHVAGGVDLSGCTVLEVGSGRGGGSDYIKRYLKPAQMYGVDYAEASVKFCNRNYAVDGLDFKVGSADQLPFDDGSIDAVVNVESSHCYPSMEQFLYQVVRVLRDGGYFLFADLRPRNKVGLLRRQLSASGLKLISETDITANVVRALELDNDRKVALIRKNVGKTGNGRYLKFAGTTDTVVFRRFEKRETRYLSYVLQKQVAAPA